MKNLSLFLQKEHCDLSYCVNYANGEYEEINDTHKNVDKKFKSIFFEALRNSKKKLCLFCGVSTRWTFNDAPNYCESTLHIKAALPISVSSERSFSCLRRLKTYFMKQDRQKPNERVNVIKHSQRRGGISCKYLRSYGKITETVGLGFMAVYHYNIKYLYYFL